MSPPTRSTALALGLAALGALGSLPPASAETEGPHALLERIRTEYRSPDRIRDGGRIEITPSDGLPRELDWSLEVRSGGGGAPEGYVLRLRPAGIAGETEERVVWLDPGGATRVWDRLTGLQREASSLPAAVAGALRRGGLEALAIPVFLAGSDEALADPEGAAFEGEDGCGDDTCRLLYLSRMAGDLETWLWVDENALVRRLEVARYHPDGSFLRIRVDHDPVLGAPVEAAFAPPAESRVAEAGEWPGPIDDQALAVFGDVIDVQLLTASIRVVDSRGNPDPDLGPEDFLVLVNDEEVDLAAVDWVPARGTSYAVGESEPTEPDDDGLLADHRPIEGPTQERPVIVFVQADYNAVRIKGHLKFRPFVDELLAGLGEGEKIAVVSYDSHLKLWSDFTSDREATREAIDRAIRFGAEPELGRSRGSGPFLADSFDVRAAKDAATPEEALTVVGRALQAIPGKKDMIFLGWGLGTFTSFGFRMQQAFREPLTALSAASTTVYVLDITDADLHTLQVGLEAVAAQTGGTYAKTNRLGAQATRNLLRALSGHYVLTIDKSSLPPGVSELKVRLRDPDSPLRILGRPSFTG